MNLCSGGFMDDKKIKKISKKELLEILLSQAKRIEELEVELNKCKDKLGSKKIMIDEAGSIAEASLKLNDIFEAAQTAVDQYTANIHAKCKKLESDTKKECQKMKQEALEYVAQAEEKVKKLTEKKEKKVSKNVGKEGSKKIKNKLAKTNKKRKVNS